MPMFEYRCPDCQKDFEEFRPLADRDNLIPCPNCGSRRPTRKLSLFAATGDSANLSSSSCSSGGFT